MKYVFVGGCGRSGTTFLAWLLSRNTGAVVTPESQFKFNLLSDKDLPSSRYLDHIISDWRYKAWCLDRESVHFRSQDKVGIEEFMRVLVREYARINKFADSDVWIDHTPHNLDFVIEMDAAFPGAKYIHIVRDGRAVAASVLPLPWGPNTTYHVAAWWIERLALGFAAEGWLGKDRCMRVYYEDLVLDPEKTMSRLSDFIGLPIKEQHTSLKTSASLPDYTKSQHALVNSEPAAARVSAWRTTLSPREVEIFELGAHKLLHLLNYELATNGQIRPIGYMESFRLKLVNFVRKQFINRHKLSRRKFKSR